MPRLSLDQLNRGMQLRVEGKSYADIAEELGVPNSSDLSLQIMDTTQAQLAQLGANFAVSVALDLARLEEMVPENLRLAKEGSDRHVKAVIAIMRQKWEILDKLREIEADDGDDDTTIRVQDPEYVMALENINVDIIEGRYEESSTKSTLNLNDISDDEMDRLRTQLAELDLYISNEAGLTNDEEEDETDY